MPGHNNIFSGFDQLLAFFNNRTWKRDLPYGTRGWGPRGGRKYKRGTNYVPEDGPAYLHKGEAVIPKEFNQPARRTEVMKLLALVGKDIEKGNKQSRQRASSNNNNDNKHLETVIDKLTQQVQLLTELVVSSRNIEDKPVISEGDIKRSYDKRDTKASINHGIFTGKPGGA